MSYLTDHIDEQFKIFLQSWPAATSAELQAYFDAYRERIGKENSNSNRRPFWIYLPQWLMRSFSPDSQIIRSDKKFLKDIMWAQYCVFLAIRVHDDLYDGQSECKSLIYAGDQLIVDSGKIFSKYFSRSSIFWKYYYNLIESTVRAIVIVDNLQKSPETSLPKLLKSYADVCSIFKIGTLALCCYSNKMKNYKNISYLIDRLSIVGHMIDDLKDLKEDLLLH